MRLVLLALVLLLTPAAAAWSVSLEAPAEAPARVPFTVRVCAQPDAPAQLRVLASNATLDAREDRYRAAFDGARCDDLRVEPEEGVVRIEARLRDAAREELRARAWANVTLVAPLATRIAAEPLVVGEIAAFAFRVDPIVALVDEARAEVLVEAYTLTSADVAAALARAEDRGVEVRVLLEGAPVGGVPADERALAATLQTRGAEVLALGGPGARYRTVHAKLVVVDRAAATVSTENLGEGDARGYGLIVRDAAMAARIAEVIERDMRGHDVAPFVPLAPPSDALPRVPQAAPLVVARGVPASLVLSPDDPLAVARLVAGARSSIDVEMLRMEPEGPLVDALIEAARNGSRVRVLMDGRFSDATNRETAARLSAVAFRERLDLEARLDEAHRTLHAKAVVVDGRTLYVGSMNWVRAAVEDNREAGLIVESDELARWLEKEMEKDWAAPTPTESRREVAAPPSWVVLALIVLSRRLRLPRARPCRA